LFAGIVPAALIEGGWIAMNLTGAFAPYAVHVAWAAIAGVHIRRRALDA
jgi:hypothetical protein